jgi:hypothetical protein
MVMLTQSNALPGRNVAEGRVQANDACTPYFSMSRIGGLTLVVGLCFVMSAIGACSHSDSAGEPVGDLAINLEPNSHIDRDSFQASGKCEVVCFEEITTGTSGTPRARLHVIDRLRGADRIVTDVYPDAVACKVSANAKYLTVETIGALHLVELRTWATVKVWKGSVGGFWMGSTAVIVTFDTSSWTASEMVAYDPATGRSNRWAVAGLPVSSGLSGSHLLLLSTPKGPTEANAGKNRPSLRLVNEEGQVVRELGDIPECASMPVTSPSFKWIAYQTKGATDPLGKVCDAHTVLVDMEDSRVQSVDSPGAPIGVTDAGEVVLLSCFDSAEAGSLVSCFGGKAVVFTDSVLAARLVGSELCYIVRNKAGSILRVWGPP